jgi:hypothetical protein
LAVLNAAILLIAEFSRGGDPDKNAGCHRDNDPAVEKNHDGCYFFLFWSFICFRLNTLSALGGLRGASI